MLRETKHTRQIHGEPFRRWFSDVGMDLIVWYGVDGCIYGFQLCYKHKGEEKALTWIDDQGFSHKRVDDGEGRPARHKMTPMLVPDGVLDKTAIQSAFELAASEMDSDIRIFVVHKLEEIPS